MMVELRLCLSLLLVPFRSLEPKNVHQSINSLLVIGTSPPTLTVDFPTFGRPTKPIDRSFLTRANLAALVSPPCVPSSALLFFGGIVQFCGVVG
jgi:hypothetical protein